MTQAGDPRAHYEARLAERRAHAAERARVQSRLSNVRLAVFVMGVVIDHITREFASLPSDDLTELRE